MGGAHVALVTSAAKAAYDTAFSVHQTHRDASRRWPAFRVYLLPTHFDGGV